MSVSMGTKLRELMTLVLQERKAPFEKLEPNTVINGVRRYLAERRKSIGIITVKNGVIIVKEQFGCNRKTIGTSTVINLAMTHKDLCQKKYIWK